MITGLLILEDTVLKIDVIDALISNLTVSDTTTGITKTVQASNFELGAALALAIGGDEIRGSDDLYKLAEPLMVQLELPVLQGDNPCHKHLLRFIP